MSRNMLKGSGKDGFFNDNGFKSQGNAGTKGAGMKQPYESYSPHVT